MSAGVYVVVCISPSFQLTPDRHRCERNEYDWNDIQQEHPEDWQNILCDLIMELRQTGRVQVSDEQDDERFEVINNLAWILCQTDVCMGYWEIDSSCQGSNGTTIVNCYDKAKKFVDGERLSNR